jgi:hypothetical protein
MCFGISRSKLHFWPLKGLVPVDRQDRTLATSTALKRLSCGGVYMVEAVLGLSEMFRVMQVNSV